MNKNYLINDEVMDEFCEVEVDGGSRGMSVIDFYEEFGYESEGGKLIKKFGKEVIGKEFVERCKEFWKDNDEEGWEIDWG